MIGTECLECLRCGKILKLPQYIDTDNYDGQVVCQECRTLLYIKLIKEVVRKYKVIRREFREKPRRKATEGG